MKEIRESPDAIEIAERKRRLLEYLLEEEGIRLSDEETIAPGDGGDRFPLSFAQQRLWFLDQLGPGSPIYNIPVAVRLSGRLDTEALGRSLNEVARRHEILRTRFVAVEGRPAQVIVPDLTLALPLKDLSHLAESELKDEALRLAAREARQGFDLSEAPLVRARLLRLGESEHILLLTMHHIVSDGWSMGIFLREVTALYDAFVAGRPSPLGKLQIQYKDFALWQRNWLRDDALERQIEYWKEHLGGDLPTLGLPTDRARPAVQTYRGRFESLLMPKELSDEIKRLSRREDATQFMTLFAAFNALLHRYSGQKDILIGTPIANRNREEIEGLIGFFVNTLVMRTDLSGDPTFRELLNRAREVALGAYAHQDLPFEKLVEELQPARDLGRTPLFQVMFVLQNTPLPEIEVSGLRISPLEANSGTAKFDLTLSIDDAEEGLCAALEYNTDLFEATTIRRMLGHFQTLLEAVAANPQERISRLPLMNESERQLIIHQSNPSQAHYPKQHTIHQLFELQVERSPDAVALRFEDQTLTYRELNSRANRLAHHLRSLGAGPESLVGILADRSIEMIVAIIGVIKSGAAYVPLDPAYPKQRLELIISDAHLDLIVTQAHLLEQLPQHQSRIVCLDKDWAVISSLSDANLISSADPDNPAYVIYTSGSTGKPKGVVVTHYNVVRLF
ncbi:MAG TPA: condensation domain-containing protein, partial [Blastocatellia bacterium]|nr:condensation domain-containing protein [Blastocatellia bacterium]